MGGHYATNEDQWLVPAIVLYRGDNPIERVICPIGNVTERRKARDTMHQWNYDRAAVYYIDKGQLENGDYALHDCRSSERFYRVNKSNKGVVTQWSVYGYDHWVDLAKHQVSFPDPVEADVWIENQLTGADPMFKCYWVRKEYTYETPKGVTP